MEDNLSVQLSQARLALVSSVEAAIRYFEESTGCFVEELKVDHVVPAGSTRRVLGRIYPMVSVASFSTEYKGG